MISKSVLNKFKMLGLHVKAEVFVYMRLVTCIILFMGLLFICNYTACNYYLLFWYRIFYFRFRDN